MSYLLVGDWYGQNALIPMTLVGPAWDPAQFAGLGALGAASETTKQSIDYDVRRFEESGDANVLDPQAQKYVRDRLMSVPAADRWTDYGPHHDTWQNLWTRVQNRIQDAAPDAIQAHSDMASPGAKRAKPVLDFMDWLLGRERTNAAIYGGSDLIYGTSHTTSSSSGPGYQAGENPHDPANRGVVDDVIAAADSNWPKAALVVAGLFAFGYAVRAIR